MAVEEFHFAPYVLESAASNPEFSVFFRHHAPYILEAAAANAEFSVFANSFNSYIINGRDEPDDWSLRHLRFYMVQAPAPVATRPQVLQTTVHQISGGKFNLTARLKLPFTTAYEILTV